MKEGLNIYKFVWESTKGWEYCCRTMPSEIASEWIGDTLRSSHNSRNIWNLELPEVEAALRALKPSPCSDCCSDWPEGENVYCSNGVYLLLHLNNAGSQMCSPRRCFTAIHRYLAPSLCYLDVSDGCWVFIPVQPRVWYSDELYPPLHRWRY